MWAKLGIVVVLGCLSPKRAHAEPAPASRSETLGVEMDEADGELNQTYRELMTKLSRSDQIALRKAERAWLSFREADCAFGWFDRRDCMIVRTYEREKQLRKSEFRGSDGKLIKFSAPR